MSEAMHLSLRLLLLMLAAGAFGAFLVLQIRRDERHPFVMAALAFFLVAGGMAEYRAQSAEALFGRAASKVAQRDVAVRCQGLLGNMVDISQELGSVWFDADGTPADKTDIKRDACNWAKEYASGKRRITMANAVAVQVIAHEAVHLSGEMNEAITECYGMQHAAEVAQELGATPMQAQQLAEFYWEAVYPDMPDEYRTSDCVNGGPLDLRPDTDVWP